MSNVSTHVCQLLLSHDRKLMQFRRMENGSTNSKNLLMGVAWFSSHTSKHTHKASKRYDPKTLPLLSMFHLGQSRQHPKNSPNKESPMASTSTLEFILHLTPRHVSSAPGAQDEGYSLNGSTMVGQNITWNESMQRFSRFFGVFCRFCWGFFVWFSIHKLCQHETPR